MDVEANETVIPNASDADQRVFDDDIALKLAAKPYRNVLYFLKTAWFWWF